MLGKSIKIRSSDGGDFDCHLAVPQAQGQVPAIVLASAVHGVDGDIIAIAEEFAGHGFIAAAPDLFWRTIPGPLSHDDGRTQQRSQPLEQPGFDDGCIRVRRNFNFNDGHVLMIARLKASGVRGGR